jgi:hypothetical protein
MLYMPKMSHYKIHTTNCVHKLINYKIINNAFDNIGAYLKIQKDFLFISAKVDKFHMIFLAFLMVIAHLMFMMSIFKYLTFN